jgi:iturin family lipopeptide synthetase A
MVNYTGLEIAVTGLSGRFPQGDNVPEYWNNLRNGKNCISEFSEEELLSAGESEHILKDVNYVRFGSVLKNKDYFDAGFFHYRPDEARTMDPQIRLFHECCWEALEDSGLLKNHAAKEKIGLFASASSSLNWGLYASLKNAEEQFVDNYSVMQLSDVNYLCSLISYKLDLRGPVLFLHTACSSSLAAIHQACNSLLLGECKSALAGGVAIITSPPRGYLFRQGGILSVDGKCCPFDHKASGTVFGEGAGVVVLRRLKDALKDGDRIHAIIKGSAINNDGNDKVGYTAPSVNRQAEVISKAIKNAGVEPDSIGYVEAHGTGTALGDPIEVEALTKAYRASGSKGTNYCMLGSVKSNIGHLDAASGVAGFIKVVMSLKNRQVPPTLNYEFPNPYIDFDHTPFFVNDRLTDYNPTSTPLRAGISSLGVGGTNVHMILEEAPSREASSSGRPYQLMTLSGKTPEALKRNVRRLREYLEQNTSSMLADVAFTQNTGRASFDYRKMFVGTNREDIIRELFTFESEKRSKDPLTVIKHRRMAFMFPGQGAQYPGMCLELFNSEKVFKAEVERCLAIIGRLSGKDIRTVLFAGTPEAINNTAFAQPALFIVEYSLARLLMSWGIQPEVMIGHSIGEYTAACLSGVFTLDDALRLVIMRGELMSQMERGSMLSISISEEALQSYLQDSICLAAVNSPSSCVVSGPKPEITAFGNTLENSGLLVKKLYTSHAFHSHMMDGMLAAFEEELKQVNFGRQKIPFISNLTGMPATDEEIAKPEYWVSQVRHTVRFSKGISTLLVEKPTLFLEVGPGRSLGSFVGAHDQNRREHTVIQLLSRYAEKNDSLADVIRGVGELWATGFEPDWKAFYDREQRWRLSLPGYSFEPTKYPVEVDPEAMIKSKLSGRSGEKKRDLLQWFYTPTWKLSPMLLHQRNTREPVCTLLLADGHGVGETIAGGLRERGDRVIEVGGGDKLQPLFEKMKLEGLLPERIIHCGGIADKPASAHACFYSLVEVFTTAQRYKSPLKEVSVLTSGLHDVLGYQEASSSYAALGVSLLKVIGQEYPALVTGHIDISLSEVADPGYRSRLLEEILHPQPGKTVSYRNNSRWTLIYDKVEVPQGPSSSVFKAGGVYLITGGLGGFGLTLSRYLSKYYSAKLILLGTQSLTDEKSKSIKAIRDEGGEVFYFACDISDRKRFSEVLEAAEQQVGPINGVFHAAGVTHGRSINTIDQLETTDFETQFSPKINGLLVLYEVLKDRKLDFCLATSSLSAVLGGIWFGAYAPANSFMDYFIRAHKTASSLKNWISINLDAIDFNGIGNDNISNEQLPRVIEHALLLKELPQLILSVKPLQQRLDDFIDERNGLPEGMTNAEEAMTDELSGAESTLFKLWVNFFGRADFGIDDNFFEVGGDSLKALTLIARINRELSINLGLADFFRKPRIRSLATYLSDAKSGGTSPTGAGAIKKAPIKSHYALSSSQRRIYYLYEMDRQSLAYNIPKVVRVNGDLDSSRLAAAFTQLVSRHESLRTFFTVVEGQVVQKIADHWELAIDQMECPEKNPEELIRQFFRPFDLSKAPLLRVGLIKLSDQEQLLLADMHHIITDGVSMGIMIREFMALYKQEDLPALRLQYTDFSEWQQQTEGLISDQRNFWKHEFLEEVCVLDLPTDHPRPAVKSYQGANFQFEVDKEKTRLLRAIAEEAGATVFMTMLSVYNVLLHKLSNQEDITIGVGIAGRSHADLEGIIGMFVNTLALRNYPKSGLSFRQLLSEVKAKVLSGIDNQLYPYEELVNFLNIPRAANRNPLFDVMFTLQNFGWDEFVIPGLTLSHYGIARRMAKVDIELTIAESADELLCDFEYATDLFEKKTISRFASYFQKIVAAVTENPDRPLSEIDILPAEERRELLYTFNAASTYDPDTGYRTIIELFREQVKNAPEKTAVCYLSRKLSYSELDEKSSQVAIRLRALGIGSGNLVGILQEPSELLPVSLLGVLKAGGAFVPIDKDYPESRKRHIIESSGLNVVLTTEDVTSMLTGAPAEQDDLPRVSADGLAYVLFTSGSTGLPKGVMIGHDSLFNYLSWARDTYIRGEEGTMALFSSISFDLTITSMFLPLITGNTLYVYQQEPYSAQIERVVSDGLVSVLKLTPSHLKLLREGNADLSRIRCMVVGGEPLDTGLAEAISNRGSDALEIYNEYGPTETTVGCVIHRYHRREAGIRSSVLIGKPAPNNEIYILDDHLHLLPRGVPGEMYIGGRQLFRGYIAAGDQTVAVLLSNPFVPGKQLYKTGDLGRWLPDGRLEFLGRLDHQVKIRGYRIELGEIESQLMRHPEIKEVVVLTRERGGEKYLVAFYVSASNPDHAALRNHLSGSLPEYMLPAFYVPVTSMPLTANGKLDKNALPHEDFSPAKDHIAPATKEEKLLCDVWSKVLSLEAVGVTDDFFSIGGDSIRSIQICSRIKNEGYKLTVKDIITHKTIRALASLLQKQVAGKKITPAIVTGVVPLSGIQHWFFENQKDSRHHYNQAVMLNFPERITEEEVRAIFGVLHYHHDALRMSYTLSGSTVLQENRGPDYLHSLSVQDMRADANPGELLLSWCNRLQTGIDLEQGHLMKAGLFDWTDGSRLLIVIHHLVVDGISWRILFEDVETLYKQIKSGEPMKLPLKTNSFKLWSERLRSEYIGGSRYKEAVSYWNASLNREMVRITPIDPSGSNKGRDVVTSRFRLPKTLTGQLLGDVHSTFKTRVNDLLLAGFLMSVNEHYGHGALQVDLEGHGREEIFEEVDVSRTVGWFTSIFPVILEHRGQDLPGLIKTVKETLRAVPDNGIGYLVGRYLTGDILPWRPSRINFNYLGQFDSDTEGRVFSIAPEPTGDAVSPSSERVYDWEVSGMVAQGCLEMYISYSPLRYTRERMGSIMASFEAGLKALIDCCLNYGKQELTPSDLTYKGLTISQLNDLQKQLIKNGH